MNRLVTLAAALTLGACAGSTSEPPDRPPAPPGAPVVVVTMRDHRFELGGRVPAGRVVFRVTNAGQERHHLTLIPLPEDVPPIAEQLRGETRRLVEPFAGIFDRAPGDTGTFAVQLAPGGRYAMICSLPAGDGEAHWMKGMATEFRTEPDAGAAAAPPGRGAQGPRARRS